MKGAPRGSLHATPATRRGGGAAEAENEAGNREGEREPGGDSNFFLKENSTKMKLKKNFDFNNNFETAPFSPMTRARPDPFQGSRASSRNGLFLRGVPPLLQCVTISPLFFFSFYFKFAIQFYGCFILVPRGIMRI